MSVEIIVLIYGLLIGSFLNVVIYRLPLGKGLALERSHCTKCNKLIYWYENIPVLSYLFLRGKCSKCKTCISFRYPLVELISGLGTFFIFKSLNGPFGVNWYEFILLAFIFYIFICHFFIDVDHQILPDSLNIILLIFALILSIAIQKNPWQHWLIGGAIGFGSTFLITYLFYKLRGKIGLGGGDIKLYGILGVILGPLGIYFNIFLSCMLGTAVILFFMMTKKMSKDQPLAFGPSIIVIAIFQIFTPTYYIDFIKILGF